MTPDLLVSGLVTVLAAVALTVGAFAAPGLALWSARAKDRIIATAPASRHQLSDH